MATAESSIEFPTVGNRKELDEHIKNTYGDEVLTTLRSSVGDQEKALQELHKQGLNGRAEKLEKMYRLHNQEFDRKETLLGKVWKGVTWPFRKSWEFAKKHPFVTTGIVLAAAAGGTYLMWDYLGKAIIIPNAVADAANVADVIAAPTGGAFDAAPVGDIVPPNLDPGLSTDPMIITPPGNTGIEGVPLPKPTGTGADVYNSGTSI